MLQRLTIYSGNGAKVAPISGLYRVRGFWGVYIGAYSRVSAQVPVMSYFVLAPRVNEGVEKISRLDLAALTKKGPFFIPVQQATTTTSKRS